MSEQQSASDAAEVFVQTGESIVKDLDRWQQVGEEEARMVYEMTLRNELSGGTPVVREFEAEWRRQIGTKHALTTVNGTSALYSAFFGLGVGPGDEVLCPDYTWICTVSPVFLLGAKPVFVESDPRTMLIDPADLKERITPRTKAIVAVHLWGWVCEMDAIMAVADAAGLPVVEDCSHCHGATYKGRPCGSIGEVGCWSLQGTKPVSAGEGGVIATDNTDCFERACLIGQVNRIKGMDLQTTRYQHLQPLGTGMKFRAHPLGIGIAAVQLRKLGELNARRGAYVEAVEAGLTDIPGLDSVPTAEESQRGGYYGFPIHFDSGQLGGVSLEQFAAATTARGLPTGPSGYGPLHKLPIFAEGFDLFTGGRGPLVEGWAGYKADDFPVTNRMLRELLFVPVLSDPVDGAAEKVLAVLREAAVAVRDGKR